MAVRRTVTHAPRKKVTGAKKEVDGLVKVTRVTVPSGEEADETASEFNTRRRSKARENASLLRQRPSGPVDL